MACNVFWRVQAEIVLAEMLCRTGGIRMKKIVAFVYGLCIFVLYLLCSWVFVYAVFERELVIALLCPVAMASIVGMVWANRKDGLI